MVTKEEVMDALKKCFDPEIGINVVDLGLIYDIRIDEKKVDIDMTLTTPGCPLHTLIAQDAYEKVASVDGIDDVNVNVVWEPAWTPDRLSDEAKKMLGYVD